jgi:very-short-patch-repair endonuclease
LAIELDGQSHVGKEEYDERRTAFLEARGITVLRYENRTVFENAEQIYMDIEAFLAKACARGMEVETVRQIKNPSVTPITPHEY